MPPNTNPLTTNTQTPPSLFGILPRYKGSIAILVLVTIIANAFSLVVPKILSHAIDTFTSGTFNLTSLLVEFTVVAFFIFVFTYMQNIVQVYASEKVARDLRNDLAAKISEQSYAYVEEVTGAKLLTNLTSDVDSVKTFFSTAIASMISSVFLIIGTSILLVLTNWKLGLTVLSVVPVIGITFFVVLRKVRKLFLESQAAIDWLNKVISESILGAALIRLLNSESIEKEKFLHANTEAKRVSLKILSLFASLIPVITFLTNLATLSIILLGGHFVITNSMTIGEFTAFNSYLAILIFPILIIGFMSSIIAQAQASYTRISAVLTSTVARSHGKIVTDLTGAIEVRDVSLVLNNKNILKNVSFTITPSSKTAIIGPTAAGKSQLLYLMTGLTESTAGTILYDNKNIQAYSKQSIHSQVGFVFQDSLMFNLTLRENIAFSNSVKDADIALAIETAELTHFIDTLPEKLDTMVSERGTSLSGGQKQRIMLARALALHPKILFLDDFTARVDTDTEQKILANIAKNYPDLTLLSVTQKIESIEHYDQIILLVEGEVLASGTHSELIHSSPEYVQIYESQRSTSDYETTG